MTPVAITERAEHCVQSSTFEITGAPLSAEELRKPPPSCRKAHGRGRPPGISCLRKKLCQVVALGCLLGSVTLAQNVQRKFRPGTNFSKYQTYRWVENKNHYPDPTVDAQIKQTFDTQLAARGLKKTDGTADLNVDYQTAVSQQETWVAYEDWTAGAGAGCGVSRLPQHKQVIVDVGTLCLDMYDTAAKQLVWTASATKILDPKSSSEDRQKNVEKAAKKLLENFPPRTS